MTTDFVLDSNPTALLFALEAGIAPDYVKQTSVISEEDLQGLHKGAFANPEARTYPIHTKAATWLSAAYAIGKGEEEHIIDRIVKCACNYGIENDVVQLIDLFRPHLTKSASTEKKVEPKYALSVDMCGVEGRGIEHFYSMDTPGDIIGSCENALQDYEANRIPLFALRKAAKALRTEMEINGIDKSLVPSFVVTLGADKLPETMVACHVSSFRKEASCQKSYEEYDKIVTQIIETTPHPDELIDRLEKVATEICLTDMRNQVQYDSISLNPYAILFSGIEREDLQKLASSVVDIEGSSVPVEEFLNIPEETVFSLLGEDVTRIVKSAKEKLRGPLDPGKTEAAACMLREMGSPVCGTLLNIMVDNY